jgi:hypothetical protein
VAAQELFYSLKDYFEELKIDLSYPPICDIA